MSGAAVRPGLGPLDFGEVVRISLRLYRARPLLFLTLAAVTVVPVGALRIATDLSTRDLGDAGEATVAAAVAVLPAILLLPISGAATTVAGMAELAGVRIGVAGALRPVGRRVWPLIATLTVSTLAIAVGLVAFVAPGLWLLVIWLFAAQTSVVEERPPRLALDASRRLVEGAWVTLFVAYVIIQALAVAVQLLLALAARPVVGGWSETAQIVASGAWATLVTLAVQPVVLLAVTLLYLDRCVRRRGEAPAVPADARR